MAAMGLREDPVHPANSTWKSGQYLTARITMRPEPVVRVGQLMRILRPHRPIF